MERRQPIADDYVNAVKSRMGVGRRVADTAGTMARNIKSEGMPVVAPEAIHWTQMQQARNNARQFTLSGSLHHLQAPVGGVDHGPILRHLARKHGFRDELRQHLADSRQSREYLQHSINQGKSSLPIEGGNAPGRYARGKTMADRREEIVAYAKSVQDGAALGAGSSSTVPRPKPRPPATTAVPPVRSNVVGNAPTPTQKPQGWLKPQPQGPLGPGPMKSNSAVQRGYVERQQKIGMMYPGGRSPIVHPDARRKIADEYVAGVHRQVGLARRAKERAGKLVEGTANLDLSDARPTTIDRARENARSFLAHGMPEYLLNREDWGVPSNSSDGIDYHGIVSGLGQRHGFPVPIKGDPGVGRYAGVLKRLRYAQRHAPKNGIVIAGKRFVGGEWIPGAAYNQATPAQKALLTHRGNIFKPKPAPPPGPLAGRTSTLKAEKANPGKGRGVGFVSPETGEGLGLKEATVRRMEGQQRHFMRLSAEIDRKLGMHSSIDPGIGMWAPEGQTPGAEPTTVATYRSAPDYHAIRYATAAKAYAANQHQALAFGSHASGPDKLWSMMVAEDLSGLHDILKKHGIPYHTVRLSNGGKNDVMIFDQGGGMDANIQAAAKELGVDRPAFRSGKGEFLGGDGSDRRRARKKFRQIMRNYESRFPERPHYEWQGSGSLKTVRMAEQAEYDGTPAGKPRSWVDPRATKGVAPLTPPSKTAGDPYGVRPGTAKSNGFAKKTGLPSVEDMGRGRYAADRPVDWADDVTDEAEGYSFSIGEMRDSMELDDSERYEMMDADLSDDGSSDSSV